MPRPKPTKLDADGEFFVRMTARGYSTREIIKELYHMEEADDPKAFHNYECKLSRYRRYPDFMEVFKDEIAKVISPKLLGKGVRVLSDQMDSKEPWLANKAANDIVAFTSKRLFAEEDNAVTIQFAEGAGMPEIGTPDGEEK